MDASDILTSKWALVAGASITGFVGGAGLGYFMGKRKAKLSLVKENSDDQLEFNWNEHSLEELHNYISMQATRDAFDEAKGQATEELLAEAAELTETINTVMDAEVYRQIVEEEIENVREEVDTEEAVDSEETPEDPEVSEPEEIRPEVKEEEPVVQNIFTRSVSNWDYDNELASRSPDAPYILHEDEFLNDELGLTQVSVTYFEGDNVIADENDIPVYDHNTLLGELRFGHGTNNSDAVYIRNEKIGTEYEVLRVHDTWANVVQGLAADAEIENELRHSRDNYRFRSEE